MKNHLIFLIIVTTSISCSRLDGVDQGDWNTYTWQGTLYEGYSDVPLPNARLELEYVRDGITGGSAGVTEDLGEAITDANGNFSITYTKINRAGGHVSLYLVENNDRFLIYSGGTPNQSYFTDFATIRHFRINLRIEGLESTSDTLIMRPLSPLESDFSVTSDLVPSGGGGYVMVTGGKEFNEVSMKASWTGNYEDSNLSPWFIRYVIGKQAYYEAQEAPIDEDWFERQEYDLYEFPKTNDLVLDVSE